MSTVRDLIKDSMLLLGVIGTSETPTADEQDDVLRALNRMLATWSIEGLLIYQTAIESFALIPSQQSYTMGPTGDFDTTRPVAFEEATLTQNNTESPIRILTSAEWSQIVTKNIETSFPLNMYPVGSFPLETILFWPIPTVAYTVNLYTRKELLAFASANDAVSLPPGYETAIVPNLAMKIAPMFGKPTPQEVADDAKNSLGQLKRQNTKPKYMRNDAFGLIGRKRTFNILSGE